MSNHVLFPPVLLLLLLLLSFSPPCDALVTLPPLLAVDFGLHRTGLSQCDPLPSPLLPTSPMPLSSYYFPPRPLPSLNLPFSPNGSTSGLPSPRSLSLAASRVASLVSAIACGEVVVGLPLSSSGGSNSMTEAVRAFAAVLSRRLRDLELNAGVLLVDERYSSSMASAIATSKRVGVGGVVEKGLDGEAASIILQQFLATNQVPEVGSDGRMKFLACERVLWDGKGYEEFEDFEDAEILEEPVGDLGQLYTTTTKKRGQRGEDRDPTEEEIEAFKKSLSSGLTFKQRRERRRQMSKKRPRLSVLTNLDQIVRDVMDENELMKKTEGKL